jgi:hypothetical protein
MTVLLLTLKEEAKVTILEPTIETSGLAQSIDIRIRCWGGMANDLLLTVIFLQYLSMFIRKIRVLQLCYKLI